MQSRTELLIGKLGCSKLAKSNVILFGVGGVGGYVAEMLIRAGVGNLTIVDFDKVDISNINRQIIALNSTVGKPKVEVLHSRLLDINPKANIVPLNVKYCAETYDNFDFSKYDYVVDAIDIVTDKIQLIVRAHNQNTPIVSAMGAGNRLDVPQFKIADIYKTYNDGLAKVLRKKLREHGIQHHTVVFSESLASYKGDTVGSISYYPAMCGTTIAAYVINELIKGE